jgi:hypothetical protein
MLTGASVRTEQYVTIVVPEHRIARAAKQSGGGLEGRCRELYPLMGEVEACFRGPVGMTAVRWLTSPELAAAIRTGFAPGDRAGIVEAKGMRAADPGVNADVALALAGPSGAEQAVRHYRHDAWNSVSATIVLPTRGALMGALAPVLTPAVPAERRSLVVVFPVVAMAAAERKARSRASGADLAEALNEKVGRRTGATEDRRAAHARALDGKLAQGHALTRPYAVCTATVPATHGIAEAGRGLDASVRRAGFAPLRLDLAQDTGLAASAIPVGIGLAGGGDA